MIARAATTIVAWLGPRTAYRLGRSLYQKARGEAPNDMATNGEMLLQRGALAGWAHGSRAEPLVVWDVGANVGEWSAALLRAASELQVLAATHLYAFEPMPETAEKLRGRLGNAANVHVENSALSSVTGHALMYSRGPLAGTSSLHPDSAEVSATALTVSMTTAVEFCRSRGISHIQLLKCDAEGHDMEVITGALPLLAEGRISVLQFEYNHRWIQARHFLRDAFQAVEGLPYRVAKLQHDRLLVFESWHHELEKFFEGNYALVHERAIPWFWVDRRHWDRFNTPSRDNGQ